MLEISSGILLAVALLLFLKFMLSALAFLPGLALYLFLLFGLLIYAGLLEQKISHMKNRSSIEEDCEVDLRKSKFLKTTGMAMWILGCLYILFEFLYLIFLGFTESWKIGASAILYLMTAPVLLLFWGGPIYWIGELFQTRMEKMSRKGK